MYKRKFDQNFEWILMPREGLARQKTSELSNTKTNKQSKGTQN